MKNALYQICRSTSGLFAYRRSRHTHDLLRTQSSQPSEHDYIIDKIYRWLCFVAKQQTIITVESAIIYSSLEHEDNNPKLHKLEHRYCDIFIKSRINARLISEAHLELHSTKISGSKFCFVQII